MFPPGIGLYWNVVGYVPWLVILVLRWKTDFQTFNGFRPAAKPDVERGKRFVLLMWHGCGKNSSSDSSLSSFVNNYWRYPWKMQSDSQIDEFLTSLFPQFIEIRCSRYFETPEIKSGWRTVCKCQNWWNIHFI